MTKLSLRHIRYVGRSLLLLAMILVSNDMIAQSAKQRKLESRRRELQKEIEQINKLLFTNQSEKKSALSEVEDLDQKIRVRQELIKVTNQQANYLIRQIGSNQKNISRLREELKLLKEDYAKMIQRSYRSKSNKSRVMFLLSSENFLQAYKRMEYMKQYAAYRKSQGEAIQTKTADLQKLNQQLLVQKKEKEALVAENRKEQKKLQKERSQLQGLIAALKSKEGVYAAQIREKEAEEARIDREIDRLIKEAIAEANKKAGKSGNSKSFALTPAAKALADNFTANKGKLPWPVKEGVVTFKFGKHPHPIVKTATKNSNGVEITTSKGAKAKAVFEGEVSKVASVKGANPWVMIRHGNYITIYRNLSKIYVKKGDKVATNEEIGEVFTNNSSGKTVLKFSIFKNTSPQDPAGWIYKM
ncbi:murein hydrolase activator EnvC family protein [Sungkyunkwania multivorans]|uniref:Murein hydrolase activator EnvC family protein n=1 Tax=Sungkyunkwania multivorans TaxID=1173618 RepID=A0ABW3D0D6_9FLAO